MPGLDASKEFINLVDSSEFIELNKRYKIEKGKFLFKINIEDFDNGVYIAASSIKCNIYISNPFE